MSWKVFIVCFAVLSLTACIGLPVTKPGQLVLITTESGPKRNYSLEMQVGTFKKQCAAFYDAISNSPPNVTGSLCFTGYINEPTVITLTPRDNAGNPSAPIKTYRFTGVDDKNKDLQFTATLGADDVPRLVCRGTCDQVTSE
jgi:hypothetical protein